MTNQFQIPQSVTGELKKDIKSESPIRGFDTSFDLSWTHYIQLLKIKDEDERNFYNIEASVNNWPLIHQNRGMAHKKLFIFLSGNKQSAGWRYCQA